MSLDERARKAARRAAALVRMRGVKLDTELAWCLAHAILKTIEEDRPGLKLFGRMKERRDDPE